MWSIVDFIIIILNLIVTIDLFAGLDTIFMRCIESFLVLLMFFKSLYFLGLNSEIAPLINIIFVIFHDILNFLLVYILGIIAFVFSFWLIGKNQNDLKEEGDEGDIPYVDLSSAFDHVYESSLGGFNTDGYWGHKMTPFAVSLFIMMSFFMCIHLLNMLIAMMGESFTDNHQVAE